MDANQKRDYPLKRIASIILKRLWIIILCIAIGSAGAYIISKFFLEKEYTASVSMYVTPNAKSTDSGDYLNYLSYSQQIIDTYTHILKTKSFLKALAETSELEYSAKDLDKMIDVEVIQGTEIFSITVTSPSPDDSYKLANTAAQLAPEKILEIKTANLVTVVDEALKPTSPSSPNAFINALIGFALGLGIGYLIVNILELLDNRIKDEDDFLQNYDIPILGVIPKIKRS